MAKRGRPKKPPELESAQGFPGRRKARTRAEIAAAEKAQASELEPQHDGSDSAFVPPPPSYLTKRAQRIWIEQWANPAVQLLFKLTDHRIVARYCTLLALVERDQAKPPRATYETTNTQGRRVIKRNPAYDQMLATMRELRSIEELIGGAPKSRLGVQRALGAVGGDGKKSPTPDEGAKPASPAARPHGPLGVLQPRQKLN